MQKAKDKDNGGDMATALSQKGKDLLDTVAQVLKGHKVEAGILFDKPQITIDASDIYPACLTLKENPQTNFKLLLCMAAVDYKEYLQMVYFLLSVEHETLLTIKTDLPYDSPDIDSVTGVWRAANWYEREAHDLFGVNFKGHPDLAPLLLYEGFEGYPGRKEFPFHEYDEY